MSLPETEVDIKIISLLRQSIETNLKYVKLSSESAREQVIIAPILLEVCKICETRLNIEYAVNVSDLLKGSFDYYLAKGKGL